MIRVLVVADSAIVRAGLAALLSDSAALTVVGTASQPTADELATLQPDVVLLDWDGQEEEGWLPAEETLPWVILGDELPSAWISEALRLNVRGLLPKDTIAPELIAAITAVAEGLTVLHPDFLERLLSTQPTFQPALAAVNQSLTPREIEVLGMLAEGLGNKAIAKRLHISEHTVKFHIGSIFSKLNASSRTEAVTLGARQGLILL
ncbi:MAG TPA: response regulator transcription factor [Coleofasciculaceae cyanobacterium]